jgi:hypothetical protein
MELISKKSQRLLRMNNNQNRNRKNAFEDFDALRLTLDHQNRYLMVIWGSYKSRNDKLQNIQG